MEKIFDYKVTTKAFESPFPKNNVNPLHIFKYGKGCTLWDKAGKEFLDFGSGIAVNALGYGREDLAQVASEQMKKLIHVSNLYTTEPALELGFKLTSTGNFDAVHLGNSGAEANEAAIKYAKLYGQRTSGISKHKILAFTNAFHGRTMGALSCTPNEKYQKPFMPLMPGVEFCRYNNITDIEKALNKDFAAVIVEPIQGEGGLDVITEAFAKRLNSLCKEFDIILIADEIQTGLARTGFPYASSIVGLEPDVITLSKPLAGGLPLSATLIPKKINKLLKVGEHGTTFGGGPVTSAVANKILDIIFTPQFLLDVQKKSAYLEKSLNTLAQKYSQIKKIKGIGLLRGIEIGNPDETGIKLVTEIIEKAKAKGLLLLKSGKNIIRIAPPLIISEKEIDSGIKIINDILKIGEK